MKTVKKILSLMLVAAMLLSVLPGQWIAAAAAPQLVVGSAAVDVSNGAATCVIPVEIKNNPGFAGLTVDASIPEGWSMVTKSTDGKYSDYYIQDQQNDYSILCSTMTFNGMTLATGVIGNFFVNLATGRVVWADANVLNGDGKLVYLTYSVPANAANGDYEITMNVTDLTSLDTQYKDQTTVVAGKVTVTGGVDKLTQDNTTVGGVNPTYTYTGSAIEPVPVISYGGKTLTAGTDYTVSYADNTLPGTATITITGTGAYQGTVTKTFVIGKADGKITGTAAYTKQYGDAAFTLDAKANSGAQLSYQSSNTAVAAVNANGQVTVVGAGSAVITVSAGETDCYLAPADFKVNVTVGAAGQTLTGTTEYEKTYGDASFRLDVRGAQGELSYTSSNPTVATVSNGTVTVKGVGTTEVTVKSAAVAGKYDEAAMTVKITVSKKPVTVSGITAADKTYDGTKTAVVNKTGAVISGKVAGDDLDVTVSGAFESETAGSGKTVKLNVSLTGAAAGNYVLSDNSQSETTAAIEKAKVEVPTAKMGLIYTGETQTGLADGDAYTVENGSAIDADIYTAVVTLKDAQNYQWADAGFNGQIAWVIEKAPALNLTRSVSVRYSSTQEIVVNRDTFLALMDHPCDILVENIRLDDPNHLLVLKAVGATYQLVNGLTAKDAGKSATITMSCRLKNYQNSTLTVTVNVIDKNDVSSGLHFENGTAKYSGQKHTLETATYNGSSEGIRYVYSADPVNAGTYTVTAIYEDEDNYGEATATLTILPTEIHVVSGAVVETRNYDGTTVATVKNVAFEGMANDEEITAADYTVTEANFADANAGTGKRVTYSVQLIDNEKTRNYVLVGSVPAASGAIEPKPITVQVSAIADQTFSGTALKPSVRVTADGTVDGYTLVENTDYTVSYKNNTNAGTAAAVVSAKNGSNYTFANAEGTFTIRKQSQPQLTVPVLTVKYSEAAAKTAAISGIPTNAGQVSYTIGQMTGKTDMVTAAAAADGKITVSLTAAQAGDQVIIPVTVEMENYESVTVELKIVRSDKDTPVAAAQDITKTYDGKKLKDSDISGVATFNGKTVKGTWQWVTDPAAMVDAGTYKATVEFIPEDETNYSRTTAELTVVVKQGKLVAPTIERNSDAKTLNDLISDKDFKDENGNQVPGKLTWYDEDGKQLPGTTEIDKQETYTWKFVPSDQKNYGSGISGTYKANNYQQLIWAAIIGGAAGGHHFDDVSSNDWFADAVSYVVREGLFEGVSDDKFDPNGNMTRAMLVTVLWRMEGSPKVYGYADFKDVARGTWYTTAVAWASKHGIVKGISDTEFAPNASITREQMAALLFRYAEYKGMDTSASASLKGYADGAKVSKYAQVPMEWAVTFGLIQGMNDNMLAPQGTATRAQVATILMRFDQWFGA